MKNRLKGFTLIELIVVMAIFSIILAAAWSFLPIAMRVTNLADSRHDGDAAVNSISSYLKSELSSVEYLDVYNYDEPPEAAAKKFAQKYYEGVLRMDSTVDAPVYAEGQVHVMTIDNSSGGIISRYTYKTKDGVGFEPSGVYGDMKLDFVSKVDSAINLAYYDDSTYHIGLGAFGTDAAVDADANGIPDVFEAGGDYEDFAANTSASNTQFTIVGTQNRNGTVNTFTSTVSLSLVNILARGGDAVDYYYVVRYNKDHPDQNCIVSIGSAQPTGQAEFFGHVRWNGALLNPVRLFFDPAKDRTKYTFVYSYSAEIDTTAP